LGNAPVILLDTHVLVWSIREPERLSRRAAAVIRKAQYQEGLAIASITLVELANLFARGRLRGVGTLETSIRNVVERSGVSIRDITPEIAALAAQFPESFSKDPADRIIAATARGEGMTLISKDEKILQSTLLKTVW
jgi:PIN domain nuclease of toxin-antitoxin system